MFNISSFLEKFSKNIHSGEECNNQILIIIEKHTQITLPKESIEIKNSIVHITASPGVKNKIFIYKNNILVDIASYVSIKIVDIR